MANSDRFGFEALLAEVAARLGDTPAPAVPREIESALARLIDFFGYDRGTYSNLDAGAALQVVASAAVAGMAPLPRGAFGPELPWLREELRAGRVVALPRLPEDLPPEAQAEAEHCRRFGVRSLLSIPLRARGRVAGVLSFVGLARSRGWTADTITRLTIIGEVFASTVGRARSEEEARRSRARLWHADRVAHVSALTAAIAHEINQPLAAILSNAQAALADLDRARLRPEALREILEAIVRDDKRAAETIRTMRALLRRDESGRARVDVAEALREVLHLLTAEFARQGIQVETEFEPGCHILADKTQIEQVALNLMLNAAAAMEQCPPGERVLRVCAARTAGGRTAVRVRDAGAGIAAGQMDAIFEPFRTTRKNGLGMGLTICRSIIEAHGGTIRVERNPDRGVTFCVELPSEAPSGAARFEDLLAESSAVQSQVVSGSLICVIDDDPAVRESLARLLSAEGHPVAVYPSALEFLEHPPAAEIGCLLLDNHMPGLSGRELQLRLAAHEASPPIVFLTGEGNVVTGVEAMKLGAVDFLVKPVEARAVLAAVRRALERNAGERGRAREREAGLARLGRLSARERQVMDAVVQGRLNKQIAADLGIALQTVKQHRARVMEKMEAGSLADLVRACEGAGLSPSSLGLSRRAR